MQLLLFACDKIWLTGDKVHFQFIITWSVRACRVILDYNVDDSLEAFRSLKILSVYDRLFLRKAKFMYKVYHGLTHPNILLKILSSEMKWICQFT